MTFIGKLLVFLTLILGVGAAVFASSVYTQPKPVSFKAFDTPADRGNSPTSFPQLAAEIDALGKRAVAESVAWTRQLKALETAEKVRENRRIAMFGGTSAGGKAIKGLLQTAEKEDQQPAFFNLKVAAADKSSNLLDLSDTKDVVVGPDGQPLKGATALLETYQRLARDITELAPQGPVLREQQKMLAAELALAEVRLVKQRDIRQNLENEAAYLSTLEVNVAEQRGTAVRRLSQLQRRLDVFRVRTPVRD